MLLVIARHIPGPIQECNNVALSANHTASTPCRSLDTTRRLSNMTATAVTVAWWPCTFHKNAIWKRKYHRLKYSKTCRLTFQFSPKIADISPFLVIRQQTWVYITGLKCYCDFEDMLCCNCSHWLFIKLINANINSYNNDNDNNKNAASIQNKGCQTEFINQLSCGTGFSFYWFCVLNIIFN